MKFKVKDMAIITGGPLVALLTEADAEQLDLHSGDRILLSYGKHEVTCILDISCDVGQVPNGCVGLFREVVKVLGVKNNQKVEIRFSGKPESVSFIRKKLFGKRLNYEELYKIIDDITHSRLTDIEKSYFVAAGFTHGWDSKEVVEMTKAMVNTGDKLKFSGVTLDKHCIGGVPGNRTTMLMVPIITAAGFTFPKTSSRAITSPAGTADTMECLARVEISDKNIRGVVKKTGGCIVHGGAMNLAPADDKIILVERPLSIDAEGQLLASVMAKKYSVTASYVLIDIPLGPSSKVKTRAQANHLKKMFKVIGKSLGMKVKVIITDGSHPIGNGVGPVLEAMDVLKVLNNADDAPVDLRNKALSMAARLLAMTGKYSLWSARKKVREILESGAALKKMNEIIAAQGKKSMPKLGGCIYEVKAGKAGKVLEVDNEVISRIARMAGAPRDKGSGVYLYARRNHVVKKGEMLYKVYAESKFKCELAKDLIKKSNGFRIGV